MEKPQPKKELVIKHLAGSIYTITAFTQDAANWLEENAQDYGALYRECDTVSNLVEYNFYVNGGFSASEVIAYLEKIGVDDKKGEQK